MVRKMVRKMELSVIWCNALGSDICRLLYPHLESSLDICHRISTFSVVYILAILTEEMGTVVHAMA